MRPDTGVLSGLHIGDLHITRPSEQPWPFVLVTQPTDRRLVTTPNWTASSAWVVRAKVLGDASIEAVEASVGDRNWMPVQPVSGQAALWQARLNTSGAAIRVRARDARGRQDEDLVEQADENWTPQTRRRRQQPRPYRRLAGQRHSGFPTRP